MARLVRHRQPKGPEPDMPSLNPPRHISTLQPRDDFGMSHGRTGNGGHRFWWKSEGRGSVG